MRYNAQEYPLGISISQNWLATFDVISRPPEHRGSALWKTRILSARQKLG